MLRTCRKKVQEVAEARWRKALRDGKQQAFREAWLRTGAAYMMKGRELKVHALRCAENTRDQQAEAGFKIYRETSFSGIKLGAGINQNW